MVACRDQSFYVGFTHDLGARISLHNKGRGSKYLRRKIPVELVFAKEYRYYKNALIAEKRLKKKTRKQKEELVRVYGGRNDR